MKKVLLSLMFMSLCLVSFASTKGTTDGVEQHDVAIIVIDMQNDFVKPGAVLCVDGALKTVPDINKLIDYGRTKNWKVIWIMRAHESAGVDVDAPRIPLFINGKKGYCVPGTEGYKLVDGLNPQKGDFIVQKYRNSAFFATQLDLMLRRMGVKTVVLAGTQYPNCVRGTANDAMSLDYETIVDTDACSAKTPEVAKNNVFDMRNMGIKCITLDEIIKTVK
jgi:nicotinamidase-related amidase